MERPKENLLVITGPTAVGKSRVAVEVADVLGGEVVSADSQQVYCHLDIGTAKLTPWAQRASSGRFIRHYLLDVVDPGEQFTIIAYQRLARQAIELIHSSGRLPLLVGGTGLYLQAVIDDYQLQSGARDAEIRQQLEQAADQQGLDCLHQQLQQVDPVAASRIHPHDRRRIIRALEVHLITGRPIDSLQGRGETPYNLIMVGLTMDRQQLYRRVNLRVEAMLASGLIDEVKQLLERGYPHDSPGLQAVGYKEVIAYLNGEYGLAETKDLIQQHTRQLVKRQLTWLRRDQRICWFDCDGKGVEDICGEIVNIYSRTIDNPVE